MPGNLLRPEAVIRSRYGFRKPKRPVLNPHHPINAGLVGLWLLNDFNNGYVNDLSASLNNGLVISGPLERTHPSFSQMANGPGPDGGIVSAFTGNEAPYVENRVEVPATSSIDLTLAVTIMAWACPVLTYSGARVMTKVPHDPVYNGYELLHDDQGFVNLQCFNAGVSNRAISTTQYGGGGTGRGIYWLFEAATYDNVTGTVYVNGKAEGTFASPAALASTSAALAFGAKVGGQFNMSGYMDGIRVYNRVLGPEEILQLYLEPYAGIWDASATYQMFGVSSVHSRRTVQWIKERC